MNDKKNDDFVLLLLKNHAVDIADYHHSFNAIYLQKLYGQMLQFAKLQLNQSDLAEDAVQESLIAAMQYQHNFKGNSAFKSWVFAILKNKIVDLIRKQQKYVMMSELYENESDEFEISDLCFAENGRWQTEYTPKAFDDSWCNPELQTENQHFWQVLEYCLTHLKSEQARVFLMKEYIGLDTQEICQVVQVSREHYYVLMHRARLQLQRCLTEHWFDAV